MTNTLLFMVSVSTWEHELGYIWIHCYFDLACSCGSPLALEGVTRLEDQTLRCQETKVDSVEKKAGKAITC